MTREGPVSTGVRRKLIPWLKSGSGFLTTDVIFFKFVPLGFVFDALFLPVEDAEVYRRYPCHLYKNFFTEGHDWCLFF